MDDVTLDAGEELEEEPELLETEPEELPLEEVEVDESPGTEQPEESSAARWRRIIGSVIVPLAVVIYLVITLVAQR